MEGHLVPHRMEAIILAGGRGTRLSKVVSDLPKPMAPIGQKPFLAYLLEWLSTQGSQTVILSVGYLADSIESFFGNSFAGLSLQYAREETPLGTGGAIQAALAHTSGEHVLVLNGDTFLQADLAAMLDQHRQHQSRLTLALAHVPDTARYGAAELDGDRITGFSEKGLSGPGYINGGIYLMRRDLMNNLHLPPAFSFEQKILSEHLHEIEPRCFPTQGYFIDIGVPEDYARAQVELPAIASKQ